MLHSGHSVPMPAAHVQTRAGGRVRVVGDERDRGAGPQAPAAPVAQAQKDASAGAQPSRARRAGLPRPLRGWPAMVLVFALLATAMRPSGETPVRAQAANTHVDTVRAEYQIILNSYVQPLTPGTLLTAAWQGATGYLQQKGVNFTTAAPNLSGDQNQAFTAFSTAWSSLTREAGTNVDLAQLAFAADDAMATS